MERRRFWWCLSLEAITETRIGVQVIYQGNASKRDGQWSRGSRKRELRKSNKAAGAGKVPDPA